MLPLRHRALPIAVVLVATLLAPVASALAVTWHVTLGHEHADIGWHVHDDGHGHTHEADPHCGDEHQEALNLEPFDGSRPWSEPLPTLQQAIDTEAVRAFVLGVTTRDRADEAERPPSPPGLARLCKLQI